MIVILGPTASGKTSLAAHLAFVLNGEVISADSRQVYRGMDIGTGKDYTDYIVNGKKIEYHLVDIADPGDEYNIFRFQQDFLLANRDIIRKGKLPVLCGGSGMYLESILKSYHLPKVESNPGLEKELGNKSDPELIAMLRSYKTLHNKTDIETRERLIRAIEIEFYSMQNRTPVDFPGMEYTVFGIRFPRDILRDRITDRLMHRIDAGMLQEIEHLLENGISSERLIRFGLEYRYGTLYLTGKITYDEMVTRLIISIHQFAKRQMTWFRRMERNGIPIHWLEGAIPVDEKIRQIRKYLKI